MTQTLTFTNARTYWLTAAFVLGNLLLPQLCHLVPQGGLRLLPIYFFTLVAASSCGWRVGLATAVLSPLLNHLLFAMPPAAALPAILVKSLLLVGAAAFVSRRSDRPTLLGVAAVVAAYQLGGSLFEWGLTGSLAAAAQDVRLGFPGLLLQVFGGWALLRWLSSTRKN